MRATKVIRWLNLRIEIVHLNCVVIDYRLNTTLLIDKFTNKCSYTLMFFINMNISEIMKL